MSEVVEALRQISDGNDELFKHIQWYNKGFSDKTRLEIVQHHYWRYWHGGRANSVQLVAYNFNGLFVAFAYIAEIDTLFLYDHAQKTVDW